MQPNQCDQNTTKQHNFMKLIIVLSNKLDDINSSNLSNITFNFANLNNLTILINLINLNNLINSIADAKFFDVDVDVDAEV